MKEYVASRSPCPIGRASRILGDRWIILILREAFLGVNRFDGFLDRLPISRATLTARLGWLVESGVMRREPEDARRAAYALTDAGMDLRPMLEAMRTWGDRWMPSPEIANQPPR